MLAMDLMVAKQIMLIKSLTVCVLLLVVCVSECVSSVTFALRPGESA